MPEPVLPMSKTALDRLGARLAGGDQIDDKDLDMLAEVVEVCQQALDDIEAQLDTLGYRATTRPKTTPTLVEKLRRERTMRLSRVQDLAGARIIVSDRPTQDEALAKIRRHFEASGRTCREVDRRRTPSHGYRAVHLIVQYGDVLVEIQIRTELEDTWAQIVEGLGDRWGRGIRYGDVPERPDATVRTGELVTTRQEALASVIKLSDDIDDFEQARGLLLLLDRTAEDFAMLVKYASQLQGAQDQRPIAELPEDERTFAEALAHGLETAPLPRGDVGAPEPGAMTVAHLMQAFAVANSSMRDENSEMLAQARSSERELRARLELIAAMTDEGE